MKDFKRIFLVASLCSVVALLFVSCGPKPMKLDANQQKMYDAMIESLEQASASGEISADEIKKGVDLQNAALKRQGFGFKIHDKKAGKSLPKGTKKDALKKRFIPVKA